MVQYRKGENPSDILELYKIDAMRNANIGIFLRTVLKDSVDGEMTVSLGYFNLPTIFIKSKNTFFSMNEMRRVRELFAGFKDSWQVSVVRAEGRVTLNCSAKQTDQFGKYEAMVYFDKINEDAAALFEPERNVFLHGDEELLAEVSNK